MRDNGLGPPADGDDRPDPVGGDERPDPVGGHDRRDRDGGHEWLDLDAGPVVRPYTVTGGRVRSETAGLDLLAYVLAAYRPDADLMPFQPEHRHILLLTRSPLSVAEIAARLDLPIGVVRVLIGDLIRAELVTTYESEAAVRPPNDDVLQAVIDGLRAL